MTDTPPGPPPAPPLPPAFPEKKRGGRLGLVVGLSAVGVVVLGVGAFFGIRALVGMNAPATVAAPVESATPAPTPLGTTEYARLDGFISDPVSSSRVVLELPAAEGFDGGRTVISTAQDSPWEWKEMPSIDNASLYAGQMSTPFGFLNYTIPAAENGTQSDMKVVQGPDYNTGNMLFLSVACLLPGDTEKMWDTMTTPGNEYSVYVDVLPASAG